MANANSLAFSGTTFKPDTPWAFTHATPDWGIVVATIGFPQDIASICTIPKASVFCTLLKQNSSQAP